VTLTDILKLASSELSLITAVTVSTEQQISMCGDSDEVRMLGNLLFSMPNLETFESKSIECLHSFLKWRETETSRQRQTSLIYLCALNQNARVHGSLRNIGLHFETDYGDDCFEKFSTRYANTIKCLKIYAPSAMLHLVGNLCSLEKLKIDAFMRDERSLNTDKTATELNTFSEILENIFASCDQLVDLYIELETTETLLGQRFSIFQQISTLSELTKLRVIINGPGSGQSKRKHLTSFDRSKLRDAGSVINFTQPSDLNVRLKSIAVEVSGMLGGADLFPLVRYFPNVEYVLIRGCRGIRAAVSGNTNLRHLFIDSSSTEIGRLLYLNDLRAILSSSPRLVHLEINGLANDPTGSRDLVKMLNHAKLDHNVYQIQGIQGYTLYAMNEE
jgi:hypothetical protein